MIRSRRWADTRLIFGSLGVASSSSKISICRGVKRNSESCFWLHRLDFYEKASCVNSFSLVVPLSPDLWVRKPARTAVQAERSEFIGEPGRSAAAGCMKDLQGEGEHCRWFHQL